MATQMIMEVKKKKTMSSKEQLNELVTPSLRTQKIQEGRVTLFKYQKTSKFFVAECKLYCTQQISVQYKTNFLVIRATKKQNTLKDNEQASLHQKYSSRYWRYLVMEFSSVLNIFHKRRKKGTNMYEHLPFANTLCVLCKLGISNS